MEAVVDKAGGLGPWQKFSEEVMCGNQGLKTNSLVGYEASWPTECFYKNTEELGDLPAVSLFSTSFENSQDPLVIDPQVTSHLSTAEW